MVKYKNHATPIKRLRLTYIITGIITIFSVTPNV